VYPAGQVATETGDRQIIGPFTTNVCQGPAPEQLVKILALSGLKEDVLNLISTLIGFKFLIKLSGAKSIFKCAFQLSETTVGWISVTLIELAI
jgi:hypothetical protein